MGSKNFVIVVNCHYPYIKFASDAESRYEEENTLVFQQISNVYLPLLRLLSKIKREDLDAKIALVFSASACENLCDEDIKKRYNRWLDNLIELGEKEVVRTKGDSACNETAKYNLNLALDNKKSFNEVWGCDILKAFAHFARDGYAEILATCGTYLFMPLFADMREVLNAQVESGLYAVRHHFGQSADGFFLPEMGYAPGIEEVLKSYGVNYTILPSQSFLFSESSPRNGIFLPARCLNGLSIFAADDFYEHEGYNRPGVYRNISADLAWELPAKDLAPFTKEGHSRSATGWGYKNNADEVYDVKAALLQANEDAEDFFRKKDEILSRAQIYLGEDTDVSYSLVFNAADMVAGWSECFVGLDAFIHAAVENRVKLVSYSDLLAGKFGGQKISPYPAAFSEFPYGENLVSNKNSWMIRYLRKACERIVDLVSRFPGDGGLKARLLNLGARELLLAQDCSLSKMVDANFYSDYAAEYFKRAVVSFTNVYDALGTNTVSTEWFCALEKLHPVFPWLNYRIFAKKK